MKVHVPCVQCGTVSIVKPSVAEGRKYCSIKCKGEAHTQRSPSRGTSFLSLAGIGRELRIAEVVQSCAQCAVQFVKYRSQVGKFCSKKCKMEHDISRGFGQQGSGSRSHAWKGGVIVAEGYRRRYAKENGKLVYVAEHRLVAESALGKHLEKCHPVHHVDEDRSNNANGNLVICQDTAYHLLLHARKRVVDAGGNPNLEKVCGSCKAVRPRPEFHRSIKSQDGLVNRCKDCSALYGAKRKRVKRLNARLPWPDWYFVSGRPARTPVASAMETA